MSTFISRRTVLLAAAIAGARSIRVYWYLHQGSDPNLTPPGCFKGLP
jgi:hypothetical protein